MRLLKYSTC